MAADDIRDEPALCGRSTSGDAIGTEPAFGHAERPDISDSGGVWGEPALADVSAAEAERQRRASWLDGQWRAVRQARPWFLLPFLVLVSGFAALGSTILRGGAGSSALALIVLAPVVEEMAKVLLPAAVLEKRPWLFASRAEVVFVCGFSGLVFATVENILYFHLYIPEEELTPGVVLWRLVACTLLHVSCASLSGWGLGRAWRQAQVNRALPDLVRAAGPIATAMVMHGLYNLGAMLYALATMGGQPGASVPTKGLA